MSQVETVTNSEMKKKNRIHYSNHQVQETTKFKIRVKNSTRYIGKNLSEYATAAQRPPEYISIKLKTLGFHDCTKDTVLNKQHISALETGIAFKTLEESKIKEMPLFTVHLEKEIELRHHPTYYIGKSLYEYANYSQSLLQHVIFKLSLLGFDGSCTGNTILNGYHISKLHPSVASEIQKANSRNHDYLFNVQERDIFSGRPVKVHQNNGFDFKSIFSDLEAFSLCGGLKSGVARALSKRFFNKAPISSQDLFDAHAFGMTALEQYGSDFVSMCLTLPPLPYNDFKITKAFQLLGKLKKGDPSVSFLLPNNAGYDGYEEHCIEFGLKEVSHSLDKETIYIKKRETGEVVAVLRSDGTITPAKNHNFYRSQMLLFISFLDDPSEALLSFGVKTGNCAICGRELSTPESAIRGIGPICAKNLGIW